MKHYLLTLSRKLAFILFGTVVNAGIVSSHAASVDSTNTPLISSAQISSRYLNARVATTPSIVTNQWGVAGYGQSGDILCPNVSNNGATTAYIMTGMREMYGGNAVPGLSASNMQAYVIGNFRYDPYCSSASSITGQCTGFKYSKTYVKLDEIEITCGTNNQLRFYRFDMNNPSSKTITIPSSGISNT